MHTRLLAFTAPLALLAGCVTTDIATPESMGGLEKVEFWKIRSELLAEKAPDAARDEYEMARRLANSWIDRKKSEAKALGTVTFGKLDLSESTLSSSLAPAVAGFETQAIRNGGSKDVGTGAALVILKAVQQLIKEGREANAIMIAGQLEQLRWRSWEEIRQ